jgi:hypothetical protein
MSSDLKAELFIIGVAGVRSQERALAGVGSILNH